MRLSNDCSIPVIGFGTASMGDRDATKTAVIEAIKLGYRLFDTASLYGTENSLGEAIEEALKQGLVGSREELFITSKLWITDNHAHLVVPALKKSLELLKLKYIDLYLIHWPISSKPGSAIVPTKETLVAFDMKGVWAAMEEALKLGLTKSIGVSNFSIKKLQNLLSFAKIPPSVNQVEMNPVFRQKKLREYCKEKGIVITGYSPLGAPGARRGSNRVVDNEILNDIAKSHGKTVAQVSLRWLYEQGVSFVVKSYNKERMKQNLEIFDWSLTESDLEKISHEIKQYRVSRGPPSLEDIWEGEE
ncbi:hypothetical protein K1719_037127 [Acacia pycnantha]|nr:hypothetical protein K1719_037127 [Acacia pycnantha]